MNKLIHINYNSFIGVFFGIFLGVIFIFINFLICFPIFSAVFFNIILIFLHTYKIKIETDKLSFFYIYKKEKVYNLNKIQTIKIKINHSNFSGPTLFLIENNCMNKVELFNFGENEAKIIYCFLKKQNQNIEYIGEDNKDPRKPRKINCDEILKDEHNFEH